MDEQKSKESNSFSQKLARWFLAILAAVTAHQVIIKLSEPQPENTTVAVEILPAAALPMDKLRTLLSEELEMSDGNMIDIHYVEQGEEATIVVMVPSDQAQDIAARIRKEPGVEIVNTPVDPKLLISRESEVRIIEPRPVLSPNSSGDMTWTPDAEMEAIAIRAISAAETLAPLATALVTYRTALLIQQTEEAKRNRESAEQEKVIIIALEWKPRNRFSMRTKEPQLFTIPPQTAADVEKAVQAGIKEGFTPKYHDWTVPQARATKLMSR